MVSTVNTPNDNANPPDLLLTNAELRDIESRRAEDDEDIRHLIAFIYHLKRKLGNAYHKVDEQRKQLNRHRIKRANIRFEDWEAEQMRNPEFRAAAEELEPAYQSDRTRIIRGDQ